VARLPVYLRALGTLADEGVRIVTAGPLASELLLLEAI